MALIDQTAAEIRDALCPSTSKSNTVMEDLLRQRATMKGYLRLRLELEDWHGVQDAASDLREIEAQIRMLSSR